MTQPTQTDPVELLPGKSSRRGFFDRTQPLGLPPGTVRAIMVLAFTFAVVFPLVKFSTMHEEIPQTVKEIILFMAGGLWPLLQSYFKTRSEETAAAAVADQKKIETAAGTTS